jgi:multiple sugar transport system substrate-binding protein
MHAIAKEHLVIEKIHSTERGRAGAVSSPRPPGTRRRRRATAGALLAALVLALTLAACGGPAASSSGGSSSTGGVVNLTWQTMWSGNTLTLLSQMVNAFNSSHPGIHVTESNIPSATGDAKLLSEIAAGDPPDVFTEWNPVLGEYAADGTIQSLAPYLTGKYSGLEKWEYPIALQGGQYNGTLYALPMSMNSWALYYNKSIMKAAGISSPPTTLAQLYADQAKEWKISGSKLEQIGFYPIYNAGFEYFGSFFGAVNCFNSSGQYDFAGCKGAQSEANFLAQYDKYPYADVAAMQTAYGGVAGGDDDAFVAGKEGFNMDGPWEGAQNIPVTNQAMVGNFGVVAFPGIEPGPSTFGQGNYNIIPKGASHPSAAFTFIAWLAGYDNVSFTSQMDPKGGWMPASPAIVAAPAYQTWLKANPWLQVFVNQMSSPYSVTPTLTKTESEFETAEATATEDIGERTKTPQQALAYIDAQANNGAGG